MKTHTSLLALVLLATALPTTARAGGGATSVHYVCGSRALNLGFQLDGRPDAHHFRPGSQVLVYGAGLPHALYVVTAFHEAKEVVMALRHPSNGDTLTVTWLGNSIVDGIRITHGAATADDGRCTPLN